MTRRWKAFSVNFSIAKKNFTKFGFLVLMHTTVNGLRRNISNPWKSQKLWILFDMFYNFRLHLEFQIDFFSEFISKSKSSRKKFFNAGRTSLCVKTSRFSFLKLKFLRNLGFFGTDGSKCFKISFLHKLCEEPRGRNCVLRS